MKRLTAIAVMLFVCFVWAFAAAEYTTPAPSPTPFFNPFSHEGSAYGFRYTVHDDSTATLDGCDGQGHVVIPASIDGHPISAIGARAFCNRDHLAKVTVPEGVTVIGEGAFSLCMHLTEVIMPASLVTIEDYAFSSSSLMTAEIPEGVRQIGSDAFRNCQYLHDVTLPASLESIGENAFSGTSRDLIFTVPAGSYAEEYCIMNQYRYEVQPPSADE